MKTIKLIISFLMLIFTINVYGQTCKVEFYLLKRVIESVDSSGKLSNFTITKDDLEDTAIITNEEIISFSTRKDTLIFIRPEIWITYEDYITHPFVKKIREEFVFNVSKTVVDRINELEIPLCCGKQFALLVDNNIIYGGYFWSLLSSFGCNGIVAFAYNEEVTIQRKLLEFSYEDDIDEVTEILKNPILFYCLKSTHRMKNND